MPAPAANDVAAVVIFPHKSQRLLALAGAGALIGAWVAAFASFYHELGLFRWLGIDFGIPLSQADLLQRFGPAYLYDYRALAAHLQSLDRFTSSPGTPLGGGLVPYPPVYAWLLTPVTWVSPPTAFWLWTGLNVAAAFHLARRAAGFFPRSQRLLVAGLVIGSFPLAYTLFVGQPVILLACALGEAYVSFLDGKDFRAGAWVACLLIKPQYGLLIGPLLIWKRRWVAVAGTAAGGALVLGTSILAGGPEALRAYPSSLLGLTQFQGTDILVYGNQMINWRGAVLRLAPALAPERGLIAVVILGLATAFVAFYPWRGCWPSFDPARFSANFVVLVSATLLASYHSHSHGAVLLAVPLAHLAQQRWSEVTTRCCVMAVLLLPNLAFLEFRDMELAAWTIMVPIACLAARLVWSGPAQSLLPRWRAPAQTRAIAP